MSDIKFCPLSKEGYCSGSACEWWDGCNCSVVAISRSLRHIANNIR